MVRFQRVSVFSTSILLLLGVSLYPTESVVGRYTDTTTIRAADAQTIQLSLGIADIALLRPDEHLFFEAIEIRAELPQAIASRSDLTLALLLYGELVDEPEQAGPVSTRGRRMHFEPFIDRNSTRIRIPLQEDPRARIAGTTRPEIVPGPNSYPIALTFLPVGKTFPEDLLDEEISIEVIPHPRDIGAVRINLTDDTGEPVPLSSVEHTFLVDGREATTDEGARMFLQPGFRSIEFVPDGFQTVSRTAAVERGRVRSLDLVLEPMPARLSISGPRGALVSVNGTLMTGVIGSTIDIEPGLNVLRFQIGDRSISQEFNAASGVQYEADLSLLLNIEEAD
ncbi:MAG: hypothetical protein ACLFNQ_08720 [Spirochaetaceae bacterium]